MKIHINVRAGFAKKKHKISPPGGGILLLTFCDNPTFFAAARDENDAGKQGASRGKQGASRGKQFYINICHSPPSFVCVTLFHFTLFRAIPTVLQVFYRFTPQPPPLTNCGKRDLIFFLEHSN